MQHDGEPEEKLLTERELRNYNGEDGPVYIAFNGIIYDVSDCSKWRSGLHEGLHFSGLELSGEIEDAPHKEEVFLRPCVKRVGRLIITT
jgi:predicted heme/steroid binding protein